MTTPLQRLQQLDFEARRKRYASCPAHAITRQRFSDKTANGLTKCVLAWLRLHGHKAWRQASEGRYRPGATITDVIGRQRTLKGQWLPGQNNGASDIACIIRGKFVAIEIKIGKDRQSDAQRRYQEEVESSGGTYLIARTFEQFHSFYQQFNSQC